MQSHTHLTDWLLRRGITKTVMDQFGITEYEHPQIGLCLRIPITDTFSKYRRDPTDPRKPKYLYDSGGKVTLYGLDHLLKTTPTPPSVVITEGELDTLVLSSLHIPAVSSTGGALSWQPEWSELLNKLDTQVFLCLDNDDAGVGGVLKILKTIPAAKVVLIPETPGVKDISDYVARGGDFRALLESAVPNDAAVVEEDRARRAGMFLSTRFHDAFLDDHHQELRRATFPPASGSYQGDDVRLRARDYPLTNLIEFRQRRALCPFHHEKTPSLYHYPKTNTAYCFGCGKAVDSIDMYRHIHGVTFTRAVQDLARMNPRP